MLGLHPIAPTGNFGLQIRRHTLWFALFRAKIGGQANTIAVPFGGNQAKRKKSQKHGLYWQFQVRWPAGSALMVRWWGGYPPPDNFNNQL